MSSKVDTIVRCPAVADEDDRAIKPKVVAKLRGRHNSETAIKVAREALEEQRAWIDRVLETDDEDWEVEVNAKALAGDVRTVGKGMVAFPPDTEAPTVDDGAPNEGEHHEDHEDRRDEGENVTR